MAEELSVKKQNLPEDCDPDWTERGDDSLYMCENCNRLKTCSAASCNMQQYVILFSKVSQRANLSGKSIKQGPMILAPN